MNYLLFYLAMNYLKIWGNFVNKPDDFDDPAIINELESDAYDNPISSQGFLCQVYKMELKKSQDLDFLVQKLEKQKVLSIENNTAAQPSKTQLSLAAKVVPQRSLQSASKTSNQNLQSLQGKMQSPSSTPNPPDNQNTTDS